MSKRTLLERASDMAAVVPRYPAKLILDMATHIQKQEAELSTLRDQIKRAEEQGPVGCVGYLDIGSGGYIDIGSDLSDEELLKLPPGRYALKPDGIFGIDGYRPIPSAPAVPEGWKLVPAEPTDEMLNVGVGGAQKLKRAVWLDMLAAAPSPEKKESHHD